MACASDSPELPSSARPIRLIICANHAIRAAGNPVEMVVIPVNGHNPADPLHREERTHRWIAWFATHF